MSSLCKQDLILKAERIAGLVEEAGGRAYYVGGCVRDSLLRIESKDLDIEVHGVPAEKLKELLSAEGEVITIGASFGVYSLKGYDIDVAMPRKEKNSGAGHRDFEIFTDPYLGIKEAAARRDFTVNAILKDVLTGELLDPWDGRKDLSAGVLRHVNSESFGEDPLRVLRGAQFAARFGFRIAEDTVEICRNTDIKALPKERIEGELKKALLKADRPSVFFEELSRMGQLDYWFAEIGQLRGIEQDPVYHPEGDVWTHTMEVIDRAAGLRERAENPYAFMLLALTHDVGKIVTTEEKNGRIHAYGHEVLGVPLVEDFLGRITGNKEIRSYVLNMVPLHMKPNVVAYAGSAVKRTNKMFDEAASPEDLILMAEADRPVMVGDDCFSIESERFLRERLEVYREMMERPYVTGRDLIEAGIEPGEKFRDILAYSHKLRLAGIEKDNALKQTLAYSRKLDR